MYEHFDPSDRVFVDREEYLEWMDKALKRCKDKAVVLHLRGIGGIGKSSLLEKWSSTIDETVRLDCDQHLEFWNRLDVLARGIVRLGVTLRRFDILWHIRKRFVEGVEPATEAGRDWAKDVLAAIPFVGSITAIGTAISAIGKKVAPRLRERYGEVGSWMQDRLGKDYMSRLLEILWKDPRHAEFLYLDALSEDLRERKSTEKPILFLFDHFEDVDSEQQRWRYGGRKITEAELWYVFLGSLKNSVGVLASRFDVPKNVGDEVERDELIELDRDSCIELLDMRNVSSTDLQNKIISVSGGNPFVIDAICDIMESGELFSDDIEDLRATTLGEVRLKTWRRLFSRAEGLHDFINRAGLLPFFNRELLNIIAPTLTADYWDKIVRLSFVSRRDDDTYVLHDLAKELVITELGDRLSSLVDELVEHFLRVHKEKDDYALLGHAISVQFLADEEKAIDFLFEDLDLLVYYSKVDEIPVELNAVRLDSEQGRIIHHHALGFMYMIFDRIAEAEHEFKEAISLAHEYADKDIGKLGAFVMLPLYGLGKLYSHSRRYREAEEVLKEGIQIGKDLKLASDCMHFEEGVTWTVYHQHAVVMMSQYRLEQAEKSQRTALEGVTEFARKKEEDPDAREELVLQRRGYVEDVKNHLALILLMCGNPKEAELLFRENVNSSSTHSTSREARGGLAETLRLTNRAQEAEHIYRQLVEEAREYRRMNPNFPMTISVWLNNHSSSLVLLQEFEKAEESYEESLRDIREYADKTPEYYGATLVWTLFDYAVLLRILGRYHEADKYCVEALELSRETVAVAPEISNYKTSLILNNRGVVLRHLGKMKEAEASYNEATELLQYLVQKHPEALVISDLHSAALNNRGVLLRKMGKLEMAEKYLHEAQATKKQLAEVSPEMFSYGFSIVMNNLAIVASETKKPSESESIIREAVALRRDLAKKSPIQYSTALASSLNNLGVILKRAGNVEEAWNVFVEALDIIEEFLAKAPSTHIDLVNSILSNLALTASNNEKRNEQARKVANKLGALGERNLGKVELWTDEEQEIHGPIGP